MNVNLVNKSFALFTHYATMNRKSVKSKYFSTFFSSRQLTSFHSQPNCLKSRIRNFSAKITNPKDDQYNRYVFRTKILCIGILGAGGFLGYVLKDSNKNNECRNITETSKPQETSHPKNSEIPSKGLILISHADIPDFCESWDEEIERTQHIIMASKKYEQPSNGTWPSIDEILDHLGYDEKKFEAFIENYKSRKRLPFTSLQLSKNVMDNMKTFRTLFSSKEPKYEGVGLDLHTKSSLRTIYSWLFPNSQKIQYLTNKVFVHATPKAYNLIDSNGEFVNRYFSASLIDPQADPKVAKGLFTSGVALILDVPSEAIIEAHHSDLHVPTNFTNTIYSNCKEDELHNIITANHQVRVIRNYVNALISRSLIASNYKDLQKKIIFKECFLTQYEKKIQILIDSYSEFTKTMTDDELKNEFKRIFNREGINILGEFKHIQNQIRKHSLVMHSLPGKPWMIGKMKSLKSLTVRKQRNECTYNEIVVHTPSNCRELGLKEPKIVGILLPDDDPEWKKSEIVKIAQKKNLSVYYRPKHLSSSW